MPINHHIDFEITTNGTFNAGAGYNYSNSNKGLDYTYGINKQTININNLQLSYASGPFVPGIPSWSVSSGGSIPSATYYIGIRYIAFGGNGEIIAKSEIVEYSDSIPANSQITINSPSAPGYPFTHYQVFMRNSTDTLFYLQLQNYAGQNTGTFIGTNLILSSFSKTFSSIQVSSLPEKGNLRFLSANRNFVSNDIGNFINIENNHLGYRSVNASNVLANVVTEVGRTTLDPYAFWFELTSTKLVKKISLVLSKAGSPTGDFFVEIRTNNNNVPSGNVLEFNGIGASQITNNPTWYDFNFNTNLAAGKYWIIFYLLEGNVSNTDYIKVGRINSTGFTDYSQNHLYYFNSNNYTWNNSGIVQPIAFDVIWGSEQLWGQGLVSDFVSNKGNLRLEILNVHNNKALVCSDFYISEINASNGFGILGGSSNDIVSIIETANIFGYSSKLHIKNGTHILNKTLTLSKASIHGYQINRYDYGLQPTIIANNTVNSSNFTSGLINIVADSVEIINCDLDGNNFTNSVINSTDKSFYLSHCEIKNSNQYGIYLGPGTFKNIWIENSSIYNISGNILSASAIYILSNNLVSINNCFIRNIVGSGINAVSCSLSMKFTIVHNISGNLSTYGHGIFIENCRDARLNFNTFNNCSNSGIYLLNSGLVIITNSIFSNNADHGILIDSVNPLSFKLCNINNNAFYNLGGNTFESDPTYLIQINPIILNSNPYVSINENTLDLTPNSSSISGQALIGKAIPKEFYGIASEQILDIGAVQSFGNQPSSRRAPVIYLY